MQIGTVDEISKGTCEACMLCIYYILLLPQYYKLIKLIKCSLPRFEYLSPKNATRARARAENFSSSNYQKKHLCFSGPICFALCHSSAVAFDVLIPTTSYFFNPSKQVQKELKVSYLLKARLEVTTNDRASKHIQWFISSAMATSLITGGIFSDIRPVMNAVYAKFLFPVFWIYSTFVESEFKKAATFSLWTAWYLGSFYIVSSSPCSRLWVTEHGSFT